MSNKLTVIYKNTPIINEKEIEGDAVVSYKGTTVQTISTGEEVKLNTKDKYTSDFITIAGEKLNTAGKIIKDFISIKLDPDYLCITAMDSTSISWDIVGTLSNPPRMQYSINSLNQWVDYTFSSSISLSVADKCYWRNLDSTFSVDANNCIQFKSSGNIKASGDLCSLINWAPLYTRCFYRTFYQCTTLYSAPIISATEFAERCCQATFNGCTNIRLSTTQTGEYQTPYRIPATGTGVDSGTNTFQNMFANTGGTFKGTPVINTTYYGAW